MKIEKDSHGEAVTIRISGDINREHLEELKTQLKERRPRIILDLKEVTLVDVDVVRFLWACERDGVKIVRCPRYVREWIFRERET